MVGLNFFHSVQYGSSFGHPAQAAMGLGWVQEWLARVTNTPLETFNSTTNSSYHTEEYFPLGRKLYVDATHDTSKICSILKTLPLTNFLPPVSFLFSFFLSFAK